MEGDLLDPPSNDAMVNELKKQKWHLSCTNRIFCKNVFICRLQTFVAKMSQFLFWLYLSTTYGYQLAMISFILKQCLPRSLCFAFSLFQMKYFILDVMIKLNHQYIQTWNFPWQTEDDMCVGSYRERINFNQPKFNAVLSNLYEEFDC